MSGPSPIVSVLIFSLPTGTWWMRSSGGRPLGSRNRPSKPTARSRSPRAYRRRCENASTPRELALAQLQPGLGVGADHDVGLALARAGPDAGAERGAADLPAAADVAEPDVVGGVEARLGPEIAGRQRAERLRDTGRKVWHRGEPTPQRADTLRSVPDVTLYDTRTRSLQPFVPRDPRRWGSTPAGRRSTRACTSATPGRSSSSRSSSAS